MAHPMVQQLRFARSEFVRCLEGLGLQDRVCAAWPDELY